MGLSFRNAGGEVLGPKGRVGAPTLRIAKMDYLDSIFGMALPFHSGPTFERGRNVIPLDYDDPVLG